MTHEQMNREFQLERANLIAHLAACRVMLSRCAGMLSADRMVDKALGTSHMTETSTDLLDKIEAYLKVGMFDQLPEEIAR